MPVPAHPGRLLRRELKARELSANRLALDLGVPSGRITDIRRERDAGITSECGLPMRHDASVIGRKHPDQRLGSGSTHSIYGQLLLVSL
jgi:hypothetical protein